MDGSSWIFLVIASDKLFVSFRPTTLPLMQTRLRELIDKLLLNESRRPANTSVCVACVFFTFRLIFSINSDSDLILEMLKVRLSLLSCAINFSCPYWCPWCVWWWCKCSTELLAFLPPIKRSWLFVVLIRDTERSTDKSSNDVNVCERAKLTCFVLLKFQHHLLISWFLITLTT